MNIFERFWAFFDGLFFCFDKEIRFIFKNIDFFEIIEVWGIFDKKNPFLLGKERIFYVKSFLVVLL